MSAVNALKRCKTQVTATCNYLKKTFNTAPPPPVGREPAFDPETKAYWLDRIGRCRAYLEYGAGASTLLAADANVPAISIESDADYADAVRAALPQQRRENVIAVNIGKTEDWGYPVWTFATSGAVKRWSAYPDAGPNNIAKLGQFPDFVLVDGRFRVACCLAMAKAACHAGEATDILLDDYALRPQYQIVADILGEPKIIGRSRLFKIAKNSADFPGIDAALAAAKRDYR